MATNTADVSSDLSSLSSKFLLPNLEVSVSEFGNEPTVGKVPVCEATTNNDGCTGYTNEVGTNTTDTPRPGSIFGCCDGNSEHAGFDTFRPDLTIVCNDGAPEHVGFDTLGSGTSSAFVHNNDGAPNSEHVGFDNFRPDLTL
ncbi:hypothetical protein U1Q18_039928 [Sarracenia purpurea var. burkii]